MPEHHICEPMEPPVDAPAGSQEWACVTCGYRVRFALGRMLRLHPGDPNARHSGGTGGLRIGGMEVESKGLLGD